MEATEQLDLMVKMTLNAWDTQNNQLNKLIGSLSDEQFAKEIAPGKNTGVYLLGHLVAVSDGLLPLLGFGERLFPELEEPFIKTPDKSGQSMPPVSALKEKLQKVTAELAAHFQACTADEWLSRHMAISPEDFVNEPHRNKLNVVISRTNHLANHLGQMLLLK
ncbi:DinB family protein [Terrimonas alba]|uniref:DinB family protein n=1 Tax=Terrimonas alba TaxID=3349636 RepID=UPI0035F3647C